MSHPYRTDLITPFFALYPLPSSDPISGPQTRRHPSGSWGSIDADNNGKEFLISKEESNAFNRNSIATEYRSDDAIGKARERMQRTALGAIGSEMRYSDGCSRVRELPAIEEKEEEENYMMSAALVSWDLDNKVGDQANNQAEDVEIEDNQGGNGQESEATIRSYEACDENEGVPGFCSGDGNQQHGEESPAPVKGRKTVAGAETFNIICRTRLKIKGNF